MYRCLQTMLAHTISGHPMQRLLEIFLAGLSCLQSLCVQAHLYAKHTVASSSPCAAWRSQDAPSE